MMKMNDNIPIIAANAGSNIPNETSKRLLNSLFANSAAAAAVDDDDDDDDTSSTVVGGELSSIVDL